MTTTCLMMRKFFPRGGLIKREREREIEAKCNCYDFMAIMQSVVFFEMRWYADRLAAMMREKGFEVSVYLEELPVVLILHLIEIVYIVNDNLQLFRTVK